MGRPHAICATFFYRLHNRGRPHAKIVNLSVDRTIKDNTYYFRLKYSEERIGFTMICFFYVPTHIYVHFRLGVEYKKFSGT